MTDINNEKLNDISKTLQDTIDANKSGSDYLIKPREATTETTKPMSISGYVDLVRDTLTHFPTHIQIRILARVAMQVADEQHKDINKLARGR